MEALALKFSIVEVLLLQRFENISEFEEAPFRLVRGFCFSHTCFARFL